LNFADQEATVGIPSNLGIISKEDAGIVLALKQLGAVPFVRTNMSQTCVSFECSNPIFGSTVNPRNVNRGPGGSSGGEGAIIAGGGSIMGFGTDLGNYQRG
jgi:fatty acid amide hydrolase